MASAAPTWDTVYERNSVERIKRDKPPLGIRDELPALIAAGYERMPEEEIVRLQWWGLYHDKPKIGTFMLRVKIPSGILTPAKLRAIGEVSNRYGRGDAELTTRQCIQLHWLELSALPDVFADLEAAGITSAGGCGDRESHGPNRDACARERPLTSGLGGVYELGESEHDSREPHRSSESARLLWGRDDGWDRERERRHRPAGAARAATRTDWRRALCGRAGHRNTRGRTEPEFHRRQRLVGLGGRDARGQ